MWYKIRYFTKFQKVIKYNQQKSITQKSNESTLRTRECTLRYAHVHVRCLECNCTKIMHARFPVFLSIVNTDWLQHARSIHGVYEYILTLIQTKNLECKWL